jgi:MerR family Zn(II)-responsive transcriptional regulator of zntA
MQARTNGSNGHLAHLMTIGEVSRRSGFTIRTLRFYERRGVLPPTARRPSGYRLYGDVDLRRLAFIRQAKALGLTLDAIRELVVAARQRNGAPTRDRLLRMLDERISQTTQQIETLTGLRKELHRRRRALRLRPRPNRERGYCTCLQKTPLAR